MDGIFISYRRDDAAGYAGRLYDRLVGHFGPEQVFMDVEGIEPGLDFVEAIEHAVGSCRVLIVIIGDEWTTVTDAAGKRRLDDPHDFIRLETGTALKRQIRVVPVLVGGAVMPRTDELPDELKSLTRRQAIEINHKQWDASSGELIRALEGILTAAIPATEPVSSQPMPIAPPPSVAPEPTAISELAATSEPAAASPRIGPTAAASPAVESDAPAAGHARLWSLLAAAVVISAAVGWWAAGRPGGSEQNAPGAVVQSQAPAATDTSPTPAAVKPAEPVSVAAVAPSPTPTPTPAPATTTSPATATPAAPTQAQSPAPEPTAPTVSAATPTPMPAPTPPTLPASTAQPTPSPPTQPAPRSGPATDNAQATTTATTPPTAPQRKPPQTPVIRTFTADTSATQVRLCYRVADADTLDLSPRPGALAGVQQDCVTVQLDAPTIFTLTARNGTEITRKRLAVVPQATGTAQPEATARAGATPGPAAMTPASPATNVPPAAPSAAPNSAPATATAAAPTPPPGPNATATSDATIPVAGERWVYRSSGKWRTSPKRRIEVVARSVAGSVVSDALTVLEPNTVGGTELRRARGDKPDFIGWTSIGPEFSPYFGAFVDLLQQGPLADLATPDLDPVWQRWQSRATVLGRESVQVPAGRFDAVKVEVWSNRRRTGSSTEARLEPVRVHYLIWYAPQVKRYVRMQRRVTSADNSEIEKDEFELLSYQRR